MTTAAILIPATGAGVVSSTSILPAVTGSATIAGFIYSYQGQQFTYVSGVGKYPNIDCTALGTTVHVFFNYTGTAYSITVPTIAENTWYFFAVTAVSGGSVYLYWGPAGSTPTQYLCTSSGSTASGTDKVTFTQATTGSALGMSFRYWTTGALTQAQVNAEAASLTPVLTTGLTYHFFAPGSTTITGLLTDTVGGSIVLTNTASCSYTTGGPPNITNPLPSALYCWQEESYAVSVSAILPPGTTQSMAGFVYVVAGGGGITLGDYYGCYPSIRDINTNNTVVVCVNNGSNTYTVNAPSVVNTWYFYAVVLNGSNLYLYWGPAGSTPVQYLVTSSAPANSTADNVYAGMNQEVAGGCYVSSMRFWTTTVLTPAQVYAEAFSRLPVLTSGLTYHFFSPASTSTAQLLTDTVGGLIVLEALNSPTFSTMSPWVPKLFQDTVTAKATVVDPLNLKRAFADTVTAKATVVDPLNLKRAFTDTVTAQATVVDPLNLARALTDTVTAKATVVDALNRTRGFTDNISGHAVLSVLLGNILPFATTVAGRATVSDALRVARTLTSAIVGGATLYEQIGVLRALSVSCLAHATLTELVAVAGAFSTNIAGHGSLLDTLSVVRALTDNIAGHATLQDTLAVLRAFSVAAHGDAIVTSTVTVTGGPTPIPVIQAIITPAIITPAIHRTLSYKPSGGGARTFPAGMTTLRSSPSGRR